MGHRRRRLSKSCESNRRYPTNGGSGCSFIQVKRYKRHLSNLFLRSEFLHIVMVALIVYSPAEWKIMRNKNLEIVYGFGTCPFGRCLLALLNGKICHLSFVTARDRDGVDDLKRKWRKNGIIKFIKKNEISKLVNEIFEMNFKSFVIVVKCTSFEANIWRALLAVPPGKVISYSELAKKVGESKKARAVGRVVAKNPIAFLIPCHRVIRKDGRIHGYKWGSEIKENILKFEAKYFA